MKRSGPLATEELQESQTTWIKRIQNEYSKDRKIEGDKAKLQLEKNQSGILVCRERIQGNHPIYIPPNNEFAKKLFQIVAFQIPPPELLPRDRTEGCRAFQLVGTDYAGPIFYRKQKVKPTFCCLHAVFQERFTVIC